MNKELCGIGVRVALAMCVGVISFSGLSGIEPVPVLLDTIPGNSNERLIVDPEVSGSGKGTQTETVFQAWDFESETLGDYSRAEVIEDFNPDQSTLVAGGSTTIVVDTINGQATQVLRIAHKANQLYGGIQMNAWLNNVHQEVFLSYNFKFGKDFNSTSGGKLNGLRGLPSWSGHSCPESGDGFVCWTHFKNGGRIITYHYDRSSEWCPWAKDAYNYHDMYFNNGSWYNVTQRVVTNTFSGGVPNADGIHEVWVDGRMIFQENNIKMIQDQHKGIEALSIQHFYGGDYEHYMPLTDCFGYIDNIKIFLPDDDPLVGTRTGHDPAEIFETPDQITDRTVYYDELLTAEGQFQSAYYGSYYPGCLDETYLVDAGEGGTVLFQMENFEIGSGDFLLIYDGNTTDAPLLKLYKGYTFGSNEVITSTGRYMFFRLTADRSGGGNGWTGILSGAVEEVEDPPPPPDIEAPTAPTGLLTTSVGVTSMGLSWNESSDNTAVTGYNIFVDGSLVNATTSKTYNLTSLTASTTYDINVSAFDAASNESDQSATMTRTTLEVDLEAPTTPTGLLAQSITGNSVQFIWNAAEDNVKVDGYNIYLDTDYYGNVATNSFTLTQLESNTPYTITVSAFDESGNVSPQSEPLNITTGAPDNEPPPVPTGLTAVSVTSSTISLVWDISLDNVMTTGYHVNANGLRKGTTFTNSFSITQLNPGISYDITVSAFDGSGNESAESEKLTKKTVNPDQTLDPKMPDIATLGYVTSENSATSTSSLTSLGHTLLQDYGVAYADAREKIGAQFFGELQNDTVIQGDRVQEDLELLYDFSEGRINRVVEKSRIENPFHLSINSPLDAYWLSGQGLRLTRDTTMLYSGEVPTDLMNRISASNEITLEAWIIPSTINQFGPARIMTLSSGPDSRTFMLGQEGNVTDFDYVVRLNTTNNEGDNGLPELNTEQGFFSLGLHHVVYTRESEGQETIYVNKKPIVTGVRIGDIITSDEYRLVLGNEYNRDRPWRGTFYLVAIYSRALNQEEVIQNYNEGFGKLEFETLMDELETNTSYFLSPFVRTDQGIVYGDTLPFAVENVLHFQGSDSLEMAFVPNPSNGSFMLSFEDGSNREPEAIVKIADISGQVVFSDSFNLEGSLQSHMKSYDLKGVLRNGFYTVMLILGTKSKSEMLIITDN